MKKILLSLSILSCCNFASAAHIPSVFNGTWGSIGDNGYCDNFVSINAKENVLFTESGLDYVVKSFKSLSSDAFVAKTAGMAPAESDEIIERKIFSAKWLNKNSIQVNGKELVPCTINPAAG